MREVIVSYKEVFPKDDSKVYMCVEGNEGQIFDYVKAAFRMRPDKITIFLNDTEEEMKVKRLIEKLQKMFNYYIEHDIDELEGYTEMLDIGITPDMVRYYVGDEAADLMEKFMEEYGL